MKKIIKNTWDCIRFPFLYPRNRWTGLHYNNWKILEWLKDGIKSDLFVSLRLTEDDITGTSVLEIPGRKTLTLEIHGQEVWVVLGKNGGHLERVVAKLKAPSNVIDATWNENRDINTSRTINTKIKKLPETPTFISVRVIHNPLRWACRKVIKWIHEWPIQFFHCLTSYTELDSLEVGWRKAFGEDLCRDLRKALWKEGGLKAILRFRITQIKEKWGYLHLYYTGGGEEVDKVISRYEKISPKTCVVCGKPATWVTTSWICPYCDDCVKGNDPYGSAERIEKEEGN